MTKQYIVKRYPQGCSWHGIDHLVLEQHFFRWRLLYWDALSSVFRQQWALWPSATSPLVKTSLKFCSAATRKFRYSQVLLWIFRHRKADLMGIGQARGKTAESLGWCWPCSRCCTRGSSAQPPKSRQFKYWWSQIGSTPRPDQIEPKVYYTK